MKNGVIDEEEFNTLQTLHYEKLNELTGVDCRMEADVKVLNNRTCMHLVFHMRQRVHRFVLRINNLLRSRWKREED